MNYFDCIILIPLLWGAYKGFRKGFILEIALLFALIVGVYCGFRFSAFAGGWLHTHFQLQTKLVPFLAFLLIFIGVIIGVMLFAKLLESAVNATPVGIANKIAGAVLGLAKWLLVLSVVLYLFNPIDKKYSVLSEETKKDSFLYEPVSAFALFVIPALHEYKQQLDLQPFNYSK
jgi:membrane protein required for colicin V production